MRPSKERMSKMTDPYKVLGVSPDASDDEIKKAGIESDQFVALYHSP